MGHLQRTAQSGSGCSLEDWCEVLAVKTGKERAEFNKETPADRISHTTAPQPMLCEAVTTSKSPLMTTTPTQLTMLIAPSLCYDAFILTPHAWVGCYFDSAMESFTL